MNQTKNLQFYELQKKMGTEFIWIFDPYSVEWMNIVWNIMLQLCLYIYMSISSWFNDELNNHNNNKKVYIKRKRLSKVFTFFPLLFVFFFFLRFIIIPGQNWALYDDTIVVCMAIIIIKKVKISKEKKSKSNKKVLVKSIPKQKKHS